MAHRLMVGGELVLHGDVGDMWGDGSGFTSREVLDALAEHGPNDLGIRLNSGGGLVYDGVAIYNAIKAHAGKVTIFVDAVAASAASLIAMAGDAIVMRAGSLMMIHDPSGVTMGNADTHRETAGFLDKIGDQGAAIYAKRSGKTTEEMREMMKAERWFTAQEAVDEGFATETDETEAEAVAAFAYDIYSSLPESIPQEAHRARPVPVAKATSRKEPVMAKTETVTATDKTADQNDKTADKKADGFVVENAADDIFARCEAAKLTMGETSAVMSAAKGNVDKAKDAIIAALADRDPDKRITPVATVTADAKDRFAEGAAKSLMYKAGIPGGEVNEFTSMTLRELARESLMQSGAKMVFTDPMAMVGAAFTMQHSTSDFPGILANVANKSMLKGYGEIAETFEQWTSKGVLTDFKPTSRVDLGLFSNLAVVPEGSEFKHGTFGERGESITLATYGRLFSITRQAIINDDIGAFTRIPSRMGQAAKRTIGDLVYAILTGNPLMSDGIALFDNSTHKNTTTGVLTTATLDAARAKMAVQTDDDQIATALNITPRFLIVPSALAGKARQLVASQFEVTASGTNNTRAPNYVRDLVDVIVDARLDADSTAEWYLAADPNMVDTIEVSYLNGNSQPFLDQKDGWTVDGTEFKVRIDAGVKALNHRGLVYSTGA